MPSVGRTRLCPGPAVHWHVHNSQREHSSRGEVAAARGGHTARTNPCFETPNQSRRTPPVTHRKLPAKHTHLVGGAQRPLLPARLTNAAPSSSVPTDRRHPTRRQLQNRWHSKDAQLHTETKCPIPEPRTPDTPVGGSCRVGTSALGSLLQRHGDTAQLVRVLAGAFDRRVPCRSTVEAAATAPRHWAAATPQPPVAAVAQQSWAFAR